MSDTRDVLARTIVRTVMCRGQEYIALRAVDAILAEFLVIPRSDIVGTEYGWRNGPSDQVCPRGERDWALLTARKRGGEAVERPALPWSVIPLPMERCSDCGLPEGRQPGCGTCHGVPIGPARPPECPSIATDGAHAWQVDVDTAPGIVACAVCPATTQWPLPGDGQS